MIDRYMRRTFEGPLSSLTRNQVILLANADEQWACPPVRYGVQ
jgi:hypothetical protein